MPVLKLSTTSPFGLSLFRSFRFSSENYSLRFADAKTAKGINHIQCFSVLKITRRDAYLETKIQINGNGKPFYESIQLPEKFVLKNVNVPDGILWNREFVRDQENKLNIICPDGHSSQIEILIDGDFSGAFSKERNEIETLPLFKTEKTYTFITTAVLTEPSLDVRADSLKGIETSPPDSVFSWLLQPEQRELIRIVLSSSASTKGAEGKLILSERKPEIRCSTITNVRTTAESIEETTLLDFDIAKAGVRTIEFVLPAWMSGAKINAPFLRRKTVTPLDTKNTDSPVLVRLELLEEVMKQLRVLVQTDRRLQSETDYRVFVPVIRTGQTMRQYIVMENDRRSPDEMVVDRLQHLQALNRQQNEWNYLASILGGNVTESYFATKNNNPAKNNSEKDNNDSDKNDSDNNDSDKNSSVNNDSGDAANLSFRMKRRETVQLADARIDLAETRFTLGDNGDYRAEQIYHIDNKKEPYLDILLPEAASLWGARILTAAEWQQKEHGENNIGLPVKPNMMPAEIVKRYHKNVTESRLIRIPLVKTESGDIDFIVRLIYAGELQHFSGWSRLDVPFIEVLNIPVGETLVRLNLPDRYEYQFKGNLRRVRQEQESETIRQIQSNYQYQQTDRLRQAVKGMNPFAAKRAKMNLKQWEVSGSLSGGKNVYSSATASGSLEGPMYRGDTIVFNEKQNDNVNIKTGSGTLTLKGSGRIEPDQSQAVVPDETATSFTSNSATLNSNFYNQSNTFSGQLVQQKALTINKTVNLPATKSSSSFNDQWFASNSLSTPNNATTQGETIYEVGKADRNRESGQVNHVFDQITVAGRQHESSSKVPVSQQQALHPPTSQVPQPQGSPHRIGSPQQAIPQQQIIPLIPQQQAVLPPAHPTTQVPQQQRNVQIVQGNLVLSDTTNGTNRDGLDYSGNVTFNSGSSTYQSGQTSQKEINASAVSSDERSLTERVKEQIENIASSPIDSATGSFDNRRSSTKAEPSSDRFSVTEGKNTTLGLSKPDDSSGQSGIANSNSISSTGHVTPLYSRPAVSERDGNRREESMRNRRSVTLEPVTPKTDQSAETATVEQILPALSMRTSSLDIEIPNTGKTFLFTASQGSLDLSFRTISNRTGSRGVQMLAAFLGLAFLYGIYCLCFSIGNRLTFDRRTHRNIAGLITLLSILSLILAPLVSVLSLIFAAILWITLFQRKSTTERL
jgi:hypothetical protein